MPDSDNEADDSKSAVTAPTVSVAVTDISVTDAKNAADIDKEKSAEKFEVKPVPEYIKQTFEQAQYNLRAYEPFLSCILNRMRLAYSPQIETAGVTIQRRGVVLYLSDWFAKLSASERTAVLKHEALHILNGHIPRSMAYYRAFGMKACVKQLLNTTQDMAINPDIKPLLPPGSKLLPIGKAKGSCGAWPSLYNLEDGQSFDWYFKQLVAEAQGICCQSKDSSDAENSTKGKGDKGEGKGDKGEVKGDKSEGKGTPPPPKSTLDVFESWAKEPRSKTLDQHIMDYDDNQKVEPPTGDPEYDAGCLPLDDPEALARMNEHILTQAIKEYSDATKGTGTMAGAYQEALNKILGPKPINWLNKLRNLCSQLKGGRKLRTWKRPNRRQIPLTKGTRKGPRSRIGIIVDTSGSMSSKELQLAMHEIDALAKKEEVFEIQCDTRVTSFRRRKLGNPWTVFGRGGSDMRPAFDKAIEEKLTSLVCITDGGLYAWPEQPKFPVIWVSTQKEAKFPWGSVVRISTVGNWWDPKGIELNQ